MNSVGEILKSAREAKKITLDVVNQNTKISVDVLAALEQDDLDSFESDIYLKGFLRTYAKYLGVDATDVLRALDRQRGKFAPTGGTMWDIEETVREEKLKSPRIFRRFILPLMLLLIALLIFLFVNERSKVKRLTPPNQRGYLEEAGADTRAT